MCNVNLTKPKHVVKLTSRVTTVTFLTLAIGSTIKKFGCDEVVDLTFQLDIAGLQNEDGSFSGDIWGEVDTR